MLIRRLLAWVVLAAALAGVGWGLWWGVGWIVGHSEGGEERGGEVVATAVVGRRSLEETVVTRGVVGFVPVGDLKVGAAGRVVRMPLSLGDVVAAGDVVVVVDGRAVVAVSDVDPFWRDLSRNSQGPDVMALQGLLAEAGFFDVAPDGRFGSTTEAALKDWQDHHGYAVADGVFRVGDVVIGEWPARVGQVRVEPGDFVEVGSSLASLTTEEPGVSVDLIPSDRLRVSEGDPVRVDVSATGRMAAGVLASVAEDPVEREDLSLVFPAQVVLDDAWDVPEGTQTRVVVVTSRAEDVLVVPVAAVISDEAGRPVVRIVDGAGGTRIVVVELGMSEGAWIEVMSGLEEGDTVVVAATFTGG